MTFYKVKSFLENGKVSNIDLRSCDNIIINECELTNNNGVMADNLIGSIVMIRGLMQNIIIANNKFTKYGNDEILWLAFDPEPIPGHTHGVPESERELMVRSNIRITNNTILYRRPEFPGKPYLYPSNVMGVMITFESYRNTYWENVLVAYNDITVKDVVRRIFWVQHAESARSFHSFRFIGNKITHDYLSTEADGWGHDFWLTGDETTLAHEAIEIAQNEFIAAETIGKSNLGHVCIVQNGLNLNVHDNLFDGSRFKVIDPYTYQQTGITVFSMENYSGMMNFCNNRCINTGNLGQVVSVADGQTITMNISDNYVCGGTRLYFSNVSMANIRLDGNYFESDSYELMMLYSPKSGSIWASNNIWETMIPESSEMTNGYLYQSYPPQEDVNLSRTVFMNNVITGSRMVTGIHLPASAVSVIYGNTLTGVDSAGVADQKS